MPVSQAITRQLENSSWIRRMFEDGVRMKRERGIDAVLDFSLGNPDAEPPAAVLEDGTIDHLAKLRDRLGAGFLRLSGTGVNGAMDGNEPVPRVVNTTNIWFDNLEGEALVIALDLKEVAVSGGSACHSGTTEPSHVLLAMGLDKTRARASLRFSLLKAATETDVDYILRVVPEAVAHLRAISPGAVGTAG